MKMFDSVFPDIIKTLTSVLMYDGKRSAYDLAMKLKLSDGEVGLLVAAAELRLDYLSKVNQIMSIHCDENELEVG
jgi:hypothetical protein